MRTVTVTGVFEDGHLVLDDPAAAGLSGGERVLARLEVEAEDDDANSSIRLKEAMAKWRAIPPLSDDFPDPLPSHPDAPRLTLPEND